MKRGRSSEGLRLELDASEGIWLVFVVSVWCETMLGNRGENWLVVLLCVYVAALKLMSSAESVLGSGSV